MLLRQSKLTGRMLTVVILVCAFTPAAVMAEPSVHYADAPRTQPAYMSYTRAYAGPSETITYADPPAYVSYRRAYRPQARVEYVVGRAPASGYVETVSRRTCEVPSRVLHITTPAYYSRPVYHRRGHHYPRLHRYHRSSPVVRYAPPFYRPVHRHNHHYRDHGWGLSIGLGRGYHGQHRGFVSFSHHR